MTFPDFSFKGTYGTFNNKTRWMLSDAIKCKQTSIQILAMFTRVVQFRKKFTKFLWYLITIFLHPYWKEFGSWIFKSYIPLFKLVELCFICLRWSKQNHFLSWTTLMLKKALKICTALLQSINRPKSLFVWHLQSFYGKSVLFWRDFQKDDGVKIDRYPFMKKILLKV